jgi:hypothetical protein
LVHLAKAVHQPRNTEVENSKHNEQASNSWRLVFNRHFLLIQRFSFTF